MNRSTIRILLILFTVITAAIHLFLGVLSLGDGFFGFLFILNSLGFLGLLVAVLRPFSFLEGREALTHYGLMAFSAVTILAWLVINGDFTDMVGLVTKIDEVLLIVAAWMHLQAVKGEPAAA